MPTPRILIVDDEGAVVFAMRDYFSCRGYDVDAASDLAQAIARVDAYAYSVVIADLCLSELPSAEGLEVASYVRKKCPDTAVVLFTASGSAEVEAEGDRRGVRLVLNKPQPLAEVERLVAGLAGRSPKGGNL